MNTELTYSNKFGVHSKVLETLKEIIREESLPIKLEEGESLTDHNGSIQVDTLITTHHPDQPKEIVNYALNKAINLTFNLTE